jgi:hypothetical protein
LALKRSLPKSALARLTLAASRMNTATASDQDPREWILYLHEAYSGLFTRTGRLLNEINDEAEAALRTGRQNSLLKIHPLHRLSQVEGFWPLHEILLGILSQAPSEMKWRSQSIGLDKDQLVAKLEKVAQLSAIESIKVNYLDDERESSGDESETDVDDIANYIDEIITNCRSSAERIVEPLDELLARGQTTPSLPGLPDRATALKLTREHVLSLPVQAGANPILEAIGKLHGEYFLLSRLIAHSLAEFEPQAQLMATQITGRSLSDDTKATLGSLMLVLTLNRRLEKCLGIITHGVPRGVRDLMFAGRQRRAETESQVGSTTTRIVEDAHDASPERDWWMSDTGVECFRLISSARSVMVTMNEEFENCFLLSRDRPREVFSELLKGSANGLDHVLIAASNALGKGCQYRSKDALELLPSAVEWTRLIWQFDISTVSAEAEFPDLDRQLRLCIDELEPIYGRLRTIHAALVAQGLLSESVKPVDYEVYGEL